MIDADPLFAFSPSGEIHILPGSPCVDAGTNTALFLPATDFEGDPRIWAGYVEGPGPGLRFPPSKPVVDIGADELYLPVLEEYPQGEAYHSPAKGK